MLGHILLLTAGNSQVAGLRVEGEEREVHGARQRQRYPAMKMREMCFHRSLQPTGTILNDVRTERRNGWLPGCCVDSTQFKSNILTRLIGGGI